MNMNMTSQPKSIQTQTTQKQLRRHEAAYVNWHFWIFGICLGVFDMKHWLPDDKCNPDKQTQRVASHIRHTHILSQTWYVHMRMRLSFCLCKHTYLAVSLTLSLLNPNVDLIINRCEIKTWTILYILMWRWWQHGDPFTSKYKQPSKQEK